MSILTAQQPPTSPTFPIFAVWRHLCLSHLGVHVGAVQIDLAAVCVNQVAHFSDVLLKDAEGGGVGEHHGCQISLVFVHLQESSSIHTLVMRSGEPSAQTLPDQYRSAFVDLRWPLWSHVAVALKSSHQSLQVCQVSVAVFVHLHHLNLHASHLSAGWVGTVGGLWDQTHLKSRTEKPK